VREVPQALGEMVAGVSPVSLFHGAFETTAVGIVLVDLAGKIRHANPVYCDLYGYRLDELVGREVVSLKHADDREATREELGLVLRGERESFHSSTRSLTKRGAVLWVHTSISLLRDEQGRPQGLMAVVEDTTLPRVMDEARLELHHEREALMESATEGIYGLDLDCRCTFVNRVAAEMLGYTRDEMLGQKIHDLVHHSYPDGSRYHEDDCAIIQACKRRGPDSKVRNHEEVLWHKDGSMVLVEHSAEPVVVDGQVRGLVVTLRDLSGREQRQAERHALVEQERASRQRADILNGVLVDTEVALREALQEQLQLMEAIPQMVWVVEPDGSPRYVNERWRQFTGIDPRDKGGRWLSLVHPDDRERTEEQFRAALETGVPYEVEHRLRRVDGMYRWVLARAHPLVDATGTIVRWFGTSTDVHDRKTAEELLRRAEKLAAAGRLAATVAHEINNPLEAVANLLYLAMHDEALPPTAARYLQTANDELRRVGHIVSQTLGFYRDSSAPQMTDLGLLVCDVLVLYQRKLDGRRIRVTRNIEEGVKVHAVTGELRQVIANLVTNAIDAMEPEGVLGVEVRRAKDEAILQVSDTGSGISSVVVDRIFEPFFTTKKDVGTGLGLWVSKGIVEKHHGRIEVHSSQRAQDRGTSFIIALPAID
jgi:PAS domain S-box-containing protein